MLVITKGLALFIQWIQVSDLTSSITAEQIQGKVLERTILLLDRMQETVDVHQHQPS